MNALEILKADHQKIRDLFVSLRESNEIDEKRDIYDRIREEIEIHSEIEESTFYPGFSAYGEMAELVAEMIEDHEEIEDILGEIEENEEMLEEEGEGNGVDEFLDLLDELVDAVERHIEIEETEFFDEASRLMSESELESLGRELIEAREEISRAA